MIRKTRILALFLLLAISLGISASPLTLQEAKELALKNNKTLQIAQLDLQSSLRSAETQSLLPSFSLSTGTSFKTSVFSSSKAYSYTIPTATVSLGMTVSGSSYYEKEAHDVSKQGAQQTYSTSQNSVLTSVTTAYWNVVASQLALKTANANLESANATLASQQEAYDGGKVDSLTLYNAELSQYDAKLSAESAQTTLDSAMRSLSYLIGTEEYQIDGTLPEAKDIKTQDEIISMIPNSLYYQSGVTAVRKAEVSKKQTFGTNVLPTIGVSTTYFMGASTKGGEIGGTYGVSSYNDATFTDNMAISASVSVPLDHIFTNSSAHVNLENAERSVQSANISLTKKAEDLEDSVKNAYTTITTAKENITKYQKHVDMYQTKVDLTQSAYDGGRVTFSELTTAKNALYTAEIDLLQQQLNYITSLSSLADILTVEIDELYK